MYSYLPLGNLTFHPKKKLVGTNVLLQLSFPTLPFVSFPKHFKTRFESMFWSFFHHVGKCAKCFYNEVLVNWYKSIARDFNFHVQKPIFVGPGPTETGTTTFNPTFVSFTLLEPILYWVKVFRLFRLEWIFLVFRVWTQ